MQLLKLVYICNGWMLGLYGRPLTREIAEAWTYGPVLPSVYHDFKRYGSGKITDLPYDAPLHFDPQEISVMNQVWNSYSKYNGIQLSALTHKPGTPWAVTMSQPYGSGSKISNDLIEQHYKTLSQQR